MFLKKTDENYDRQRKKMHRKAIKGVGNSYLFTTHDRRLCFFTKAILLSNMPKITFRSDLFASIRVYSQIVVQRTAIYVNYVNWGTSRPKGKKANTELDVAQHDKITC